VLLVVPTGWPDCGTPFAIDRPPARLEQSSRRAEERPDAARTTVDVPGEEQRLADADELAHALGRLSARQQQVLVWRYYFDQSVQETADQLGLTESKVKDATHEAVTKLGRLLDRTKETSS
jgi:RNA polymerase sigma factor (sigma-70 family)